MYQGCVDTRNMDYLSHGDWAKHFQSSIHSFNEGMKTAKYDHITIITYQISFLPSLNYLLCQRRMCVLTGLEFFSYSNCLYLGTAVLHHWEDWLEHTERLIMYSYMYQNIESYTVNAQHPAILLWYVCVFMPSWSGIILVIDHAAQPRSECWILVTGLILVSLL